MTILPKGCTLQGMRLKRLLPFAVLAGSFLWSNAVGGLRFLPIYDVLTIKAAKNSPPHIAFEELQNSIVDNSGWERIAKAEPVKLSTEKIKNPNPKILLAEMSFKKQVEQLRVQESDNSWMNELSRTQVRRVQEAQQRHEVLDQNWTTQSWSELAHETLVKSGALKELSEDTSNEHTKVFISGTDTSGKTRSQIPRSQVYLRGESYSPDPSKPRMPADAASEELPSYSIASVAKVKMITGAIEITGGLAVTNEHHIEIRRSDEGVLKELGRVDLIQGTYKIEVEDVIGSVVARLVNKDGKTMGEGSFRLSRVENISAGTFKGPKLQIAPQPTFASVVTSAYHPNSNRAPANSRVTFVKGTSDIKVDSDSLAVMENIQKGSSTVMRAAAPDHYQSATVVVAGSESRVSLFPETMISAFRDIVSQQRQLSLDENPNIIWGQTKLDGKPVSGIEVQVESDPSLVPVYFNEMMLPDSKLNKTSSNGIFAFLDASPGYHSLLATRAGTLFGFQNVVVEEGSIAVGDIEATLRSEPVPLRVYDAFSGEFQRASIEMQSLQENLEFNERVKTITLPQVNRTGLMRVQPEGTEYLAARYLYNDKDSFVHIPLVQWSWLSAIKNYLKINDSPSSAIIVGFVPDQDFEIHLAGYDNFDSQNIVYFDMQGRILQNKQGLAGGGFILYNVPPDTHEVVLIGKSTQKIGSRVLPVDPNTLSVLSFRD